MSVGYADVSGNRFVAVSGSARLSQDPDKAKQLWSTEQLAYYPDGPEDARLALLRVQMERAEYWLAPGRSAYVVAAARAVLTGKPAGIVGREPQSRLRHTLRETGTIAFDRGCETNPLTRSEHTHDFTT